MVRAPDRRASIPGGKPVPQHGSARGTVPAQQPSVTAPRRVLPNATLLVTRRCSERRFFFRPSPAKNELFLYTLASAAAKFEVQIHAFCLLSNHFHGVLTDLNGVLPAFEQYLDSLVARAFNALLGRWESFWAPGSFSAVTLSTPEAVLDKMAYVLANPVTAGLVRRGSEWPGLWSDPSTIGGPPIEVSRPKGFFRERDDGPMKPTVKLRIDPPPVREAVEAFRHRLAGEVKRREDQAARELAAEGRSFLGVRKVLAQNERSAPTSGEPRRGLNPRVAEPDKWKRIEALERLKDFLEAYRSAWKEFANGARNVLFPHGTYWMRVAYGMPCAASG